MIPPNNDIIDFLTEGDFTLNRSTTLTDDEINYVCDSIKEFFARPLFVPWYLFYSFSFFL